VVFVHGVGMDHTVWRYQTRRLANRGLRVVAPDLPGHGSSGGGLRRSVPDWAEWLVSFVYSRIDAPAMLVGHSMGGLVSLEAAVRHPTLVERLVLVGVGARMIPHPALLAAATDDLPKAAGLIAGWSMPAAYRGSHPEPGLWEQGAIEALLRRSRPGVLAADLACCAAYDASEVAGEITCPTTLFSGSADRMAAAPGGRELSLLIPGAELVVLEGLGHEPMLQSPLRFNRHLSDILWTGGKPTTR
jgi:pimeloyl-ACP methyl ester carboxylesterase